ncbi:MAG: hypothetical protein ACREN5_05995 [Gemmatimonadales bacterium]
MRSTLLMAAIALAAPLLTVAAQQHDHGAAMTGGGTLPAGWAARVDGTVPLTEVKAATMGAGLHVTTGRARVVLYRDQDRAEGSYHAVARFTQSVNPPDAFGLIIGGSDLQGPNQQYTYFLVRGDGTFLVKRRRGDSTWSVTPGDSPASRGFTAHAAIVKADSAGRATNELGILVTGDQVKFQVNGQDVYATPASQVDTRGIVGLRVNHRLDVHVGGFAIHRL